MPISNMAGRMLLPGAAATISCAASAISVSVVIPCPLFVFAGCPLLDSRYQRFGLKALALARQRLDPALFPFACHRAARERLPGFAPLAQRVAVPGRFDGERGQSKLVPDGA